MDFDLKIQKVEQYQLQCIDRSEEYINSFFKYSDYGRDRYLEWNNEGINTLLKFHKDHLNKNIFFDEKLVNKKTIILCMDYTDFYYEYLLESLKPFKSVLLYGKGVLNEMVSEITEKGHNPIILKNYLSFYSNNYIHNKSWDKWYYWVARFVNTLMRLIKPLNIYLDAGAHLWSKLFSLRLMIIAKKQD